MAVTGSLQLAPGPATAQVADARRPSVTHNYKSPATSNGPPVRAAHEDGMPAHRHRSPHQPDLRGGQTTVETSRGEQNWAAMRAGPAAAPVAEHELI
jgi:hypothetical protein